METRMGPWTGFKRWVVDWLVGAETRALIGRLERIEAKVEAKVDALSPRLTVIEERLAAAAREARRDRAEQTLVRQLDRLPDLRFDTGGRSVLFLHHSYYHFFYLARALRLRGWRAVSVSIEDPNGVNAGYYHGEDLNLYDADPEQLQANIQALFAFAKANFELMHFAGDGHMGFFPQHFGAVDPPDIVEWKRLGKKLGYTLSGCNSMVPQSYVRVWSRQPGGLAMCDNCPWEQRPDVCRDERTDAWSAKVHRHCDLVFSEMQPALAHLTPDHANVIRGPVTTAVDDTVWHPGLAVPEAFRVPREPGEVLIYHAFGNYGSRAVGGRNIKGTPAVVEAVERLRAEGLPVRLIFATGVPNELVRFYQAQADIIVDQLWAGMWGAQGREGMMLGKPVVAFVNRTVRQPSDTLQAIAETPVVNATVDTLYDVLRSLVLDPVRRQELGLRSREFALAWYSPAAAAARYEAAYDAMLARDIKLGLPDQSPVNT